MVEELGLRAFTVVGTGSILGKRTKIPYGIAVV